MSLHWRLPKVKYMYHIYKLHSKMCNKYKKQYEDVKTLDANVCNKTLNSDCNINRNMRKKQG